MKNNSEEAVVPMKRKILVVEDDEDNAFMTGNTLRNYFDLKFVKSGYEAIEAVSKDAFDAVLMDINLGDMAMDGLKTLNIIKQSRRNKSLKIFAMTEASNDRDWYVKYGFEDLFSKPILYRKIAGIINRRIEGRITEQ